MLYELPDFEYLEPKSIDEALQMLSSYGANAKILAGGTDLLGLMKDRIHGKEMPIPSVLVNIKRIAELKSIDHDVESSTIGSAVTLREITSNEELGKRFPSLVQAARSVATTQIRNMGTLGGNLCQRPWCWYFRHPAFDCFKKGGKQCYAVTGDNSTYFSIYNIGTCVMSHPSDTAPALMSLRATAKIGGPSGFRDVSLEDFFLGPKNVKDNILSPEEILVSVSVPRMQDGERSIYLKHRIRNNWDFALASVAVRGSVKKDDSTITEGLRIVLGGVAPLPIRFRTLETNLVRKKYDSDAKSMISEIVRKEAKPLRMNRYKVRILRALVLRGLDQVLG